MENCRKDGWWKGGKGNLKDDPTQDMSMDEESESESENEIVSLQFPRPTNSFYAHDEV
jgi:hypothetical protein